MTMMTIGYDIIQKYFNTLKIFKLTPTIVDTIYRDEEIEIIFSVKEIDKDFHLVWNNDLNNGVIFRNYNTKVFREVIYEDNFKNSITMLMFMKNHPIKSWYREYYDTEYIVKSDISVLFEYLTHNYYYFKEHIINRLLNNRFKKFIKNNILDHFEGSFISGYDIYIPENMCDYEPGVYNLFNDYEDDDFEILWIDELTKLRKISNFFKVPFNCKYSCDLNIIECEEDDDE